MSYIGLRGFCNRQRCLMDYLLKFQIWDNAHSPCICQKCPESKRSSIFLTKERFLAFPVGVLLSKRILCGQLNENLIYEKQF